MSDLEAFEGLARVARKEEAPRPDVVAGVMRRVRAAVPGGPADRLWPVALVVSAAAASLLLALQSYLELQEPFVELLDSVRVVFP